MGMHAATEFVWKYFYWLFIALLVLNMTQRGHVRTGEKKRFATLYMSILCLALFSFAGVLLQFKLPDLLLAPFVLLLGGVAWFFRKKIFPFRLTCASCGKKLDFQRIMNFDNNLCAECDAPEPSVEGTAETPEVGIREEETDKAGEREDGKNS